jgi:hypothetical protein
MATLRQIPLGGLFTSPKRYALSRPDGGFADFKQSILGMLSPPKAGWIEQAWHTLGEIWDAGPLTWQPWFELPAVRPLSLSSPAYAGEFEALAALRPWNVFLLATAIGRKPDSERQTAVVIAPFEPDPAKWAGLPWRFGESGEPVPFDCPDAEGYAWRLRTIEEFLRSCARHPIPEMLAPDGSPCGAHTRGLLRRRPVRDSERWLVLKEAAVYGDDPANAFSVPTPEMVRRASTTDRAGAPAVWERVIKSALAVVGPAAVARKLGIAARTARAWLAGERHPENPREVARAIVAVAREAGLGLPSDEHFRAEEICGELPDRAAAVQCFVSMMVAMLAERLCSIRALARAMAVEGNSDPEPTVRRWLTLAAGEPRPIGDLNRIFARFAKFSRSEIRKMRRGIVTEPGPAGDRQAIVGHLSLLYGDEKPVVLAPREMLALPAVLALASLLAFVCQAISRIPEALPRTPT